jgi:hypothetical protein
MKYIGKYENFESNIMAEEDVDFIITKITDNFTKEEVKLKIDDESDETDIETSLIDMICWFEDKFNREILDEDDIINKLREYYQI